VTEDFCKAEVGDARKLLCKKQEEIPPPQPNKETSTKRLVFFFLFCRSMGFGAYDFRYP
jgi:hypothetical protein